MAEDWGFAHQGRLFAAPYITLVDPEAAAALQPGVRVMVPFGNREVTGFLLAVVDQQDADLSPVARVNQTGAVDHSDPLTAGVTAAGQHEPGVSLG